MKSLPARLYKYESFASQGLENLKAQRIYFGSPLGFNDPYDCTVSPVVSEPSRQEVELIREHCLVSNETPAEMKRMFANVQTDDLRKMVLRGGVEAIKAAVLSFTKERGVSCFSELNDNLLMWGHYGGKYKGYCLEFSTEEEPFLKARAVEYSDCIPSTSVVPFMLDTTVETNIDAATDFYCVKSSSWAYEREWRVVHAVAGTLFHYKAQALTGVYFGPEMTNEARDIICLILRGQNSDVRLYRGQRSITEFKVVFEEFKYLAHLETNAYRKD